MSDVFGADKVLWVEGPTEEKAFPLILRHYLKRGLAGIAIARLRSTGDIEGKQAQALLDIYKQVSRGPSFIPPAIAFVLDPEDRNPSTLQDLKKQCPELHFLSRRLYENFLLVPEAIAAVVNSYKDFSEQPITAQEVAEWIDEKRKDKKYGFNLSEQEGDWIQRIHGAKLLSDYFAEFSETRYEYVKTRNSVALTQWMLENKPDELKEIADLLLKIVDTRL